MENTNSIRTMKIIKVEETDEPVRRRTRQKSLQNDNDRDLSEMSPKSSKRMKCDSLVNGIKLDNPSSDRMENKKYENQGDEKKISSQYVSDPMQVVRPFWMMCSQQCIQNHRISRMPSQLDPFGTLKSFQYTDEDEYLPLCQETFEDGFSLKTSTVEPKQHDLAVLDNVENEIVQNKVFSSSLTAPAIASVTTACVPDKIKITSMPPSYEQKVIQMILHEYLNATKFYGCHHINAGVLTTFRFSLPTLRVSGSFHDADMLALCEVLLRHCNGPLRHIRRLDFSVASQEGKIQGKTGVRSHGAYTLSKVLLVSQHIEEVFLQRNMVGPYGAAALFLAISKNSALKTLIMRRCSIGERGALAFAEYIGSSSSKCALREVDLTVNKIGCKGVLAIENSMRQREKYGTKIVVDLEGNMVFQEVMNGVTHGLGFLLCIIGAFLLSNRVKNYSYNHIVSCAIYSLSLLVLYISSTLYHSFFALTTTRFVFGVMDQCAIYILIAGSYTPFLRISLANTTLGSVYLLSLIWICCFCGIIVEAFCPHWKYKTRFSLTMYLLMGWSVLICLEDLNNVLSTEAVRLVVLGGVAYTSGVPFFVRNNNLDHSIWHCFVLAGSLLHWLCIFFYVAPTLNE